MKTPKIITAGLAIGLALAASGALAHAKLVSGKAETSGVTLTFNEEISGKLSGATIKDSAGKAVPASAMLDGAKALMVMSKSPLKPGAYSAAWHAVASDDGHRTTGTYAFTVK